MTKKELKSLAITIAENEKIIERSDNPGEIDRAKRKIESAANMVTNLDDLIYIDELVQDILS